MFLCRGWGFGEQVAFLRSPNSKEEWGGGIIQPQDVSFAEMSPSWEMRTKDTYWEVRIFTAL